MDCTWQRIRSHKYPYWSKRYNQQNKKDNASKAVTYLSIDKFHNVWAFDDKGIFALRKEKDTFYPTYLKPDIIKKL